MALSGPFNEGRRTLPSFRLCLARDRWYDVLDVVSSGSTLLKLLKGYNYKAFR